MDDKSYRTTGAIAFAIAISSVAVILRFVARKLNKISFGADDYTMVVGALFTIANALAYVWTNKYGNGRHIETIKPGDLVLYWKTLFVSFQLYGTAITAIKVSILLFYKRVFSTAQYRKWIYGVGVLVLAWLVAGNLVFAFQCNPVQKAWKLLLPGKCINPLTTVQVVQSFNVILDACVLALPVAAVLRLQLSTAKKISILAVFLLGGLSLMIAIIRLSILFTQHLEDITYRTSICSWTVVEPAVEVLAGCLPTMAPLVKLWPRIRASFSSLPGLLSLSRGRSTTSNVSNFDQARLHLGDDSTLVSKASTNLQGDQSESPDFVPLQAIKVRRDVEWS